MDRRVPLPELRAAELPILWPLRHAAYVVAGSDGVLRAHDAMPCATNRTELIQEGFCHNQVLSPIECEPRYSHPRWPGVMMGADMEPAESRAASKCLARPQCYGGDGTACWPDDGRRKSCGRAEISQCGPVRPHPRRWGPRRTCLGLRGGCGIDQTSSSSSGE